MTSIGLRKDSFSLVLALTNANLLQQLSFELARNPDVQRELQDEINSVLADLDGETISYEASHKMKYLDMVISEILRKWPPAPQTDRKCSKDYDIDLGNGKTFTIQKGQTVFLPIYHIQHDLNYFPDPEKFDPNRFSVENKNSIVPGSYLPFGKISF
jgi:cytochrome P450 family 9